MFVCIFLKVDFLEHIEIIEKILDNYKASILWIDDIFNIYFFILFSMERIAMFNILSSSNDHQKWH